MFRINPFQIAIIRHFNSDISLTQHTIDFIFQSLERIILSSVNLSAGGKHQDFWHFGEKFSIKNFYYVSPAEMCLREKFTVLSCRHFVSINYNLVEQCHVIYRKYCIAFRKKQCFQLAASDTEMSLSFMKLFQAKIKCILPLCM